MSSDDPNWDCSGEYLGLFRTIGEIAAGALMRQRVERTLAKGALFDPLTGLPNRRMLMAKLTTTLSQSAIEDPVAVMFVDCDEFKAVNDSYGHEYGDRLLVQMASRLEAICAHTATLARFGGDEFVVMINSRVSEAEIMTLAQRIVSLLSETYDLKGATVRVTVSVGVAIHAPESGRTDTSSLLRRADVAMYQAKQAGRNGLHVYSEALESSTRARFNLLSDLRRATESSEEFDVWYQPVFDIRNHPAIAIAAPADGSGLRVGDGNPSPTSTSPNNTNGVAAMNPMVSPQLAGYEALVRWRHPTLRAGPALGIYRPC